MKEVPDLEQNPWHRRAGSREEPRCRECYDWSLELELVEWGMRLSKDW